MERSLRDVDFINVDSVVQIDGEFICHRSPPYESCTHYLKDYEGINMENRDAESKKAMSEASNLFEDYYPGPLA